MILCYCLIMKPYSYAIIQKTQQLRSIGKTYREIIKDINIPIPKSTLSSWLRNIPLPPEYSNKVKVLISQNIALARSKALEKNREIRSQFFKSLYQKNSHIAPRIFDISTAKIALAMLCLGEASKYNPVSRSSFYLGNSNPQIIILFLKLLQICYSIKQDKIRCTVQCRADQNPELLKNYWSEITGIPPRLFYKPLIDPRTVGKPTLKKEYKGVLRVNYLDNTIRHDLESIAKLVYNQLQNGPEV